MPANAGIVLSPSQLAELRAARKSAALTQEDVAVKLGVSRVAVVRYESGDLRPGAAVLRRWAAVVGFDVVELGIQLRRRVKR